MKTSSWLIRALVACLSCAAPALAGSHTWSGAASGLWSDPANWSAGGAPVDAETNVVLVFPNAQGNMAMTNDLAGLNVTSITFSDTAYTLAGSPINLDGSITCDDGADVNRAIVGVGIVLTGDATFVSTSVPLPFREASLEISGPVTGAHGVVVQCAGGGTGGAVVLGGANGYTGATTVQSGYLVAASPLALGFTDGTPATGTLVQPGATLSVQQPIAGEALTVGGNGAAGVAAILGSGTWSGPITLTSDVAVQGFGALTLAGPIGDGGSAYGLVFRDMVAVNGTNTYTGTDRIHSGIVTVNGTSAAPIATNDFGMAGGALRGTGSVAGIAAGGAGAVANEVAPGTDTQPGILTSIGPVSLGVNSTLRVRLNGPNVLGEYDQLFVLPGGPALTGAALAVVLGYAAPVGAQFTIVNDAEGPPPVGTFAGLPEGAAFVAGGETFQITYAGGPLSNSVVLTVTSPTPVELSGFAAD